MSKQTTEAEEKYSCNNCNYTAKESKFDEAKDLWQRMDPGDTFTDKECPKCGALAFPVEQKQQTKKAQKQ